MKTTIVKSTFLTAVVLLLCTMSHAQSRTPIGDRPEFTTKIQLAILLDASNSMDGLIDQAKARLWNIVNTLTTLKYDGKTPMIEIALYMYGNDGLSVNDHYVRQITQFTTDLDLISEKLFAIRTNGGSEFCGAVIDHSVKNLRWSRDPNSMKLIYIAGNEPFNQGSVSYIEAVSSARGKDIFINTIHCGNCDVGVRELWKDGADKGSGKYFCINSDEVVTFIDTPYDDDLIRYNNELNKTYIYYGSYGKAGYTNQNAQDVNAQSVSGANFAERTVSKSKSQYNNEAWDLVDKHQADPMFYRKVDRKTLPEEYQSLSDEELKKKLDLQLAERTKINAEIADLSQKRQSYIDNYSAEKGEGDDFGAAVNSSIMEIAKKMGYSK